MNLANTCFSDEHEIHLRDVPYCAQLLAQLEKWHSIVWSLPKVVHRHASRGERSKTGPRGFRRDSIPHHVIRQLIEAAPGKLTNVQLCALLPDLPHKPIAVALYELTHKGLLESEGRHNALRYGVTSRGRAVAARFEN